MKDKSDYGLSKIRVEEAPFRLGLDQVMEIEGPAGDTTAGATSSDAADGAQSPRDRELKTQRRKDSSLIISALDDQALRVVHKLHGDPVKMMTKLDERYDSKTMASKISKMTELLSLQYTSPSKDVARHIDRLAGLIDQVRAIEISIDDTLAVGILILSIKTAAFCPVVAAFTTISESDLTWDSVSQRLIEECNEGSMTDSKEEILYIAHVRCGHCRRRGRTKENFWLKNDKQTAKVSTESAGDDENSACSEQGKARFSRRRA